MAYVAKLKGQRDHISLYQLRGPLNEVILKLEGTIISTEEELQELIMRVRFDGVNVNKYITSANVSN